MKNHTKTKTKSHSDPKASDKKAVLMLFISFLMVSCVSRKPINQRTTIGLIKIQMQEQEDCWNKGDLDCFMQHYWKSDSLKFIGKSGVNYGWQTTLDNYKKGYPSKEKMGKLEFTNKSIEFIGKETIFVVGEWKLARADSLGDLGGYYSLIWKKKNEEWVIVADHSS
jgi:hypothetical protein